MTVDTFPKHEPHPFFEVKDDCLQIGRRPLLALAERVGRTPFYANDRELLSERDAELRRHLPEQLRLHYAVKANPMPELLQHMTPMVDGLDVASVREMQIALDTGISTSLVSFA